MSIEELLRPGQIVASLLATDKTQLLNSLARRAAADTGIGEVQIATALASRELLGSTGVGHGIAIPHACVGALAKPYGLFAHLNRPVDFMAIDSKPVDLVFLLLTPENGASEQIKWLSVILRLLRDQEVTKRLRASSDAGEIYGILISGI